MNFKALLTVEATWPTFAKFAKEKISTSSKARPTVQSKCESGYFWSLKVKFVSFLKVSYVVPGTWT